MFLKSITNFYLFLFSDFFIAYNPRSKEENIIKDIGNLFRQEKETKALKNHKNH